MDALQHLHRIIESNSSFWAGEYEIAYRYFSSGNRTTEAEIRWMQLQMYKEWTGSGVYPERSITSLVEVALSELREIETTGKIPLEKIVRHNLMFALDEFHHYQILSRALYLVSSEAKKSIWDCGDILEAKNLEASRMKFRGAKHGMQIVGFTEGGGLGMYFGVRDAFREVGVRSDVDVLIDEFAKETIDDEKHHMLHRMSELVNSELSGSEWQFASEALHEMFYSKLLERNAQFGHMLSQDEVSHFACDAERGAHYIKRYLSFLLDELPIIIQKSPLHNTQ